MTTLLVDRVKDKPIDTGNGLLEREKMTGSIFSPGDAVKVFNSPHRMTVEKVTDDGFIICTRQTPNGSVIRGSYKPGAIELDPTPEKPQLTAETMPLTPYGLKIIVRPDEEQGISKGGILLPEIAQQVSLRGVILAVGEGQYMQGVGWVKPRLTVGQIVHYPMYAGHELEIEGEKLKVMNELDVLASSRSVG